MNVSLVSLPSVLLGPAADLPDDIDRVMPRPVPRTRGWAALVFTVACSMGLFTPFHPADRSRGQVCRKILQRNI